MEALIEHLKEMVEGTVNRIAILEATAKNTEHCLQRLVKESDQIRETVHRIEVAQAQRGSVPLCAAPNKCLDLEKQLLEISKLVSALVESRAESRGGMRVAHAIAIALSGLIAAAVSFIFNSVHKHIP